MKLMEEARRIAQDKNFKEKTINVLEDATNAILGNPVSAAKFIKSLLESPFMMRERLFWNKFSFFLEGIYLEESDIAQFITKLSENENREDNVERIISLIDKTETKLKVQFLINATRCLIVDFIKLPEYFRICDLVTRTLYEDLDFLRKNVFLNEFDYSYHIQGLLNSGLIYQSTIDSNEGGNNKYSFTPLAELIDKYALSYDNVERYPNPKSDNSRAVLKPINLKPLTASDEEVREMLEEYF